MSATKAKPKSQLTMNLIAQLLEAESGLNQSLKAKSKHKQRGLAYG
ncbi:hypothetical protein ACMXYX_17900 (plasmid) [Neptuniibacter sp. QD72_48]